MNASTFNGGEDNPRPATPVPTARADFREGAKITVNKEDQHVREEKRRTPARPQPRRSRPAGVSEVYGLGRDGGPLCDERRGTELDRKSTGLNSSHRCISSAVLC